MNYPPAQGERNATRGFTVQYRIAARLILGALAADTLEWIRIADPEAGRLDDIQIATGGRLDAYQVKWSEYESSLTFGGLTDPKDGKPSLVAQLADGWQRLSKANPGRYVAVHLYTNDSPSPNVGPPVGSPPPKPAHFAAFLAQCWRPAKAALLTGVWSPSPEWRPAWDALQSASGLPPDAFPDFVRHCELDFGVRLPSGGTGRRERLNQDDIDQVRLLLADKVGDPERTVEIPRETLLAELKWAGRYSSRNRHAFPVDDVLYEPIAATAGGLAAALDRTDRGYLALVGPPGSGKSTLLSRTLLERPGRIIPYYAFVPDETHPGPARGESENFLHDVVLALHGIGVHFSGSIRDDRPSLLLQFQEQLVRLGEDFVTTGHKTVIFIDGIDHIQREQRVDHALFDDLPDPAAIPEGVIVLFGTQTTDPLPHRIRHELRGDRLVQMGSLTRDEVFAIAHRSGLPSLAARSMLERLYELSAGHPLALVYLLEQLRSAGTTAEHVLDESIPYRGRIEDQYEAYWESIGDDEALVELLGLIARIRGAIDMDWVSSWTDPAAARRLRKVRHYFREETPARWFIHHNSFRLFLQRKSAETATGGHGESWDRQYHATLADRCAASEAGSPHRWDEIYHRVRAGQHEAVLERASASWFREQFLAFRPVRAIRQDIHWAMESAAERQDPIAVTRLVLADAEFAQRADYLEEKAVIPLFLLLDEPAAATERLHDGRRLLVEQAVGLEMGTLLQRGGLETEARRVFDLSEPLAELKATRLDSGHRDDGNLLLGWASAAARFHDVGRFVGIVRQVRRPVDPFHGIDAETATDRMRRRLLLWAAYALAEDGRWDGFATVEGELSAVPPSVDGALLGLFLNAALYCHRDGDQARSESLMEKALSLDTVWAGDPRLRWKVAEAVYFVLGDVDRARSLVQGIAHPEPSESPGLNERFEPFWDRFRFSRLLFLLGLDHSPSEAVKDPARPSDQGLVYFERAVVTVARLDAQARRDGRADPDSFVRDSSPALILYHRPHEETREWTTWYRVRSARDGLYALLVQAAARNGRDVASALREAFERLWDGKATARFWPASTRRRVILELRKAGEDGAWARARLSGLESELDTGEIFERVEAWRLQAEAWAELGDLDQARRCARRMLSTSFGAGSRKDYQYAEWVRWLGRAVEQEPERAAGRIAWMAEAVRRLEDIEASGRVEAAEELLEVAFRSGPEVGLRLFRWFMDRGVLPFEVALRSVLRAACGRKDNSTACVRAALVWIVSPILLSSDERLVTSLLVSVRRDSGPAAAEETARQLVRCGETLLLASLRPHWRHHVATALLSLGCTLEAAGLAPADQSPPPDGTSPPLPLRYGDGSELDEGQATAILSDLNALLDAMDRQADTSYFQWEPHIHRLLPSLDTAGVRVLAERVRSKPHHAKELCLLAGRLAELGDRHGAETLAREALDAGSASGWWPWSDGGTRILAFEVLTGIDAAKWRPAAYRQLAQDAHSEYWPPFAVALSLGRVLPVLAGSVPAASVWDEVEGYITAMASSAGAEDGVRPPDLAGGEPLTAAEAVAELIVSLLASPVFVVAHGAQRAATELLVAGEGAVAEAVRRNLGGPEDVQERLLPVLDAACRADPASVRPFVDELQALAASPSFGVCAPAMLLCSRLGLRLAEPAPRKLPAVYSLQLPRNDRQASHWQGIDTEPITEVSADVDLLSPADLYLRLLSELSGVPKENLYRRAVSLMKKLRPEDEWLQPGRDRLLAKLDSVRLLHTYWVPRYQVSRRAAWHVAAELQDAGLLEGHAVRMAWSALRYYDAAMLLGQPAPRPEGIPLIPEMAWDRPDRDGWVMRADDGLASLAERLGDGRVVLGERTEAADLFWKRPTEVREAAVRTAGTIILPGEAGIFGKVPWGTFIEDYGQVTDRAVPLPVVLHHDGWGLDTPGPDWLALNPEVARRAGWRLAVGGWFRWVDGDGKIMVESVWWQDGTTDHQPPHTDQAGEGWLVVASAEALESIARRCGPLERAGRISRQVGREAHGTNIRRLPFGN